MSKKVSIIGKGTAGCITALNFYNLGYNIDWYYDSSIPPLSVGEGTDLVLPRFLSEKLNLNYDDLSMFDAHYKQGIEKLNWGKNNFTHWFGLGQMALHLNANKLQNYITAYLKNKVNIIEKRVKHEELNSYIIDCTGKMNQDDYVETPIPVNSVYLSNCSWDKPRFNKTLCVAKTHGWVFLIPLQNRCSVGYLYNKECSSFSEIQTETKEILKEYNLVRDIENHLTFENYYRKINFTENVSYNGNSSFFLEPLEATSLNTTVRVAGQIYNILEGGDIEFQNNQYKNFIDETIDIIMLHYLNRPKFVPNENDFWSMANEKANEWFSMRYKTYPKINLITEEGSLNYSTWYDGSFKQNLTGLNLYSRLNQFKNG